MAHVPAPADRVIAAKLPHDLITRLRQAAHEADRTLSGQLRRVVREWAENEKPGDELIDR
jgi:hypothetical protein